MNYSCNRALRDFENQGDESGMPGGYTDEGRRIAIRSAMEAAGHLEEDILDAIASLGLRQGGIVGLKHGGRIKYAWGGPGGKSPGHSSQGPAGGASAGGNYGGNRNPNQTYGGGPQHIPKNKTVVTGGDGSAGDGILSRVSKTLFPTLYDYKGNFNPFGRDIYTGKIDVDVTDDGVGGMVDTNIDIQSPTIGTHLLHPDATANQLKKDAAIAALYKEAGWTKAKGGRIGFESGGDGQKRIANRMNTGEFSLSELLNARDPKNELIAEHMQIGKLPFNITERIFELNRGGKSYEDIAEITGVDIEDITSILEVANKPDRIDPVDKHGKVDYDLWDDIMAENISIRERPEHLSYNAKGGRVKYDMGGVTSVLPRGREMDYRGGGMIPMGSKERADDVPARLSKNEFVMTADAVKAAGGGNVNTGAKRMYDLMHNLEARV